MTLREELGRILSNFDTEMRCPIDTTEVCVNRATVAIEKLINERYTPKNDVMEYVSEIHNLKYTAQEAYDIASQSIYAYDEGCDCGHCVKQREALRKAFGISKGKEG